MYYSNSDVENGIKRTVDTWYNNNLKSYENYIADTELCEQYKVSPDTNSLQEMKKLFHIKIILQILDVLLIKMEKVS